MKSGSGRGIFGEFAYSIDAALVPDIFLAVFRAEDGTVAVYFEAVAVIIVLVLVGRVLELRAPSKLRARSGRCSIWRRRLRGASVTMV